MRLVIDGVMRCKEACALKKLSGSSTVLGEVGFEVALGVLLVDLETDVLWVLRWSAWTAEVLHVMLGTGASILVPARVVVL